MSPKADVRLALKPKAQLKYGTDYEYTNKAKSRTGQVIVEVSVFK